MKMRVLNAKELKLSGAKFNGKVRDFITDINRNPNAIVEVSQGNTTSTFRIQCDSFNGAMGEGEWNVRQDSLDTYFSKNLTINVLPDNLFEL